MRNITKYLSQNKDRPLNKYDGISADENLTLFNALMDKMCNTIFHLRFADMYEKLLIKESGLLI